MDLEVPAEWEELTRETRKFCESEVDSIWQQIEEDDEVPAEVLRKAAALGLFGLSIPTEYGGLELPMLARALVYEELGRTHAGFTSIVGTHCGIGTTALVLMGSEEQKGRLLPPMAAGDWIGAFALTEPEAGSDASGIQTRGVPSGDGWIINGTKHFITNSHLAQVFTVFARTDGSKGAHGISAFLVERDTPGFTVGRYQKTMGLRGSHVAELLFSDCVLPASSLLGAEGEGFIGAMKTLAQGRVGIAARCVGAATRVTEMSIQYAKDRRQFGRPIGEFEMIQAYLAEMAAETAAARALTLETAWRLDQGDLAPREAAMTKLIATETYGRVVDKAVQIHGGMGYVGDYPIEHYYRDARITRIYEGTSEIQKVIIARDLLQTR